MVVVISGWQDPQHERRVSFTHLLREHSQVSMVEAKEIVEGFVDKGSARLRFEDQQAASDFVDAANGIGLICSLSDATD